MKRTLWSGLFAVTLAAIPSHAAAQAFDFSLDPQASPEVVGTPRDPGARAAEMRALQERLAAGQVKQALSRPVVVQLTADERHRIDDTSRVERKYMVGVAKPVGTTIDFAAARSLGKRVAGLSRGRCPR